MTELILFSASWCPPCKKFKKILPSLIKKYPGVDFSIIDVEDSEYADMCADITCLPTVKIYKLGAEYKVFTRVLAELDEIEDAIGS
jgi:thiol-disulfide isomerase/thioredoxin